jgi:hypothetical protein
MMSDDELADLAADIKANGLIDADGVLIDGRNRLRACELAAIEPEFESLDADGDPIAFIVSANLARRNLSKGQQAIALAMIYPEPDQRGRRHKGKAAETSDFSQKRLARARTIVCHSNQLDAALKMVTEQRQASMSTDAKMATSGSALRRGLPNCSNAKSKCASALPAGQGK